MSAYLTQHEGARLFALRSTFCRRCFASFVPCPALRASYTDQRGYDSSNRQIRNTLKSPRLSSGQIALSRTHSSPSRQSRLSTTATQNGDGAKEPSQDGERTIAGKIRSLMSISAQPVALLLTALSSPNAHTDSVQIHGATISSLTSLSLSPPLVGFSLRTPSRAADALLQAQQASSGPTFTLTLLADPSAQQAAEGRTTCKDLAVAYAVPGLEAYSLPCDWSTQETLTDSFQSASTHPVSRARLLPSSAFTSSGTTTTSGTSLRTCIPYPADGLGSFSCSLEARIRLGTAAHPPITSTAGASSVNASGATDSSSLALDTSLLVPSEQDEAAADCIEARDTGKASADDAGSKESWLLIAKVWDVHESVNADSNTQEESRPLVWWSKQFTTVQDL